MADELRTVGKSELRKDAWAKVTGEALYTADIPFAGALWGVLVRSPHHSAKIVRVEAGKALAVPGVNAIITAADIPGSKTFGTLVQDQPPLANGVVRHLGEPVVLVVANTKAAALKAADRVAITYETLPAVFDPKEALKSDAPRVHPGGNLLSRYELCAGEITSGFAQSDIVIEETFAVQKIAPAYMELETSLARWNDDGTITVWVSSQMPFEDQHHIASILGVDLEKIQVKSAVIGGAFGGKEDASMAVVASLAAWLTKNTVRLVNDRRESFVAHPKRHPAQIHLKLGARRDGTLMALQATVHMDTGAYASLGPAVGGLLTEMVPGSYRIPNINVETLVVYTNSPYSGAMRGFGSPQAHFALECLLDMLAARLGIDPLGLRRINALKPGDRAGNGVAVNDSAKSLPACLDAAESAIKRLKAIPPSPGKYSGVGMALAVQTMGLGAHIIDDSNNGLEWLPDGKVRLHLGAPDLGEGLATASEQIAAEALGLPYDQVQSVPIDTLSSPNGGVTCASRMTYMTGNALIAAAASLQKKLLDEAAAMLNVPTDRLSYTEGMILQPDGRKIPVAEFTSRAAESGLKIKSVGKFTFPYPEDTTPQDMPIGMPHVKFVFGAQVARVEVDPELGTVVVKDLVAIHDLGKVINRAAVEGQIEGGAVMGLGYALYEDMALKQNSAWVDDFTEYLLPTAEDVAFNIEDVIIENPEETGPYGVKGIGEMGLVPTAPAIANAVFDATGVRVTSLPVDPEVILKG